MFAPLCTSSINDIEFLKDEYVLEQAFRELLSRLEVPANQENSVIVYVHPYGWFAAKRSTVILAVPSRPSSKPTRWWASCG
ncbi:hypothetical protein DUNSADRAFT_62 [Dunaliella salina]|uniref:Uncharacterized protein n=1 Tax=Dunaliella salina TaxID=3046 RepID=A0ABQ7H8W2_DUNSA|nr:hypothetical protein DUNSADRAFT_62 [Dunaliella salina]|eukprot:KAF5843260.1 hypothetical protein DUNSADRAFT_62 [Dunaliella salina]